METTLIILVAILAILIIALLGVISFFLYKFIKLKEEGVRVGGETISEVGKYSGKISPDVLDVIESAKKIKDSAVGQFCVDHPELPAKGICSISNEPFCELCITKEKDIRLARKYLDLLLDFKWSDYKMLYNEGVGADKLNQLMVVKKDLWKNGQIPMITQKQFKINIETDKIEAYTVVLVRDVDKETLEPKLSFLNN